MASFSLRYLAVVHLVFLFVSGVCGVRFRITNNCGYTVWPGVLAGAGGESLSTSGFVLGHGESRTLEMPALWSGRLWGRTHCFTDGSTGKFSCATGDCGSGHLECSGGGVSPPATLAEFTLGGSGDMDFFDVSLVDGYNLPMLVTPEASSASVGNCRATGCAVDLNGLCPSDLRVELLSQSGGEGQSVACRSACEAFGRPEFCCSGAYGNPNTCKPSSYSQLFKNACPRAYSYAYDDATSTFTCATGTSYAITFCPTTTSQKAGEKTPAAAVPLINDTMVFLGAVSEQSDATLLLPTGRQAVAAAVAVAWLTLHDWINF
ncbi:hypothetical protein HPP92_025233 [Vanilla planifolia]|uniref:Thaumatin-like protein 1b n=1 Tax=Vanilla planifolia TaxID=51239 RepID=A0A835PFH1_VANPL|nr:hypothetical protein HPP92_025489 [Vanilla planifolia]KAG0453929.1 hypothetical protein HPP92_025233 [Vanilla planifolia]